MCGARARTVQALGVSARRGQVLAREQVCARRAQEPSVTDGAGSAEAAERKRECGARAEVGGAGGAAKRLRFGRASDGTTVAGCGS
jgi:shikimate 5-dehydrogenase